MLIRTNMEDMREKTHTRHYELYRKKRLEQVNIFVQIICDWNWTVSGNFAVISEDVVDASEDCHCVRAYFW